MPAHPLPSPRSPTVACVHALSTWTISLNQLRSVQLVRLPTTGWDLRCKLQQSPSFLTQHC